VEATPSEKVSTPSKETGENSKKRKRDESEPSAASSVSPQAAKKFKTASGEREAHNGTFYDT
jgi:hypothetical protein